MKPFWHPLSTLFLVDPWSLATPTPLRMLLRAGPVRMIYAGDRMWPAVRHGTEFTAEALQPGALEPRQVVIAPCQGIPDLLRVQRIDGDRVQLCADADPDLDVWVPSAEILAGASIPPRAVRPWVRLCRRLTLDLIEAAHARPGADGDAAGSVRDKYDYQAPFYSRAAGAGIDSALLAWMLREVPGDGRILVVGSGSGRECFALAGEGWRVRGVDFSPAMVRHAEEQARRRGLAVEFLQADVRSFSCASGSLDAVLFNVDVYSFLPRSGRVETLGRVRDWLAPGGVVFLSARRVHAVYERLILGLQWCTGRLGGGGRWGETHTRWIGDDAGLHRSFVHVFTVRGLEGEVRRAGLRPAGWGAGYLLLRGR